MSKPSILLLLYFSHYYSVQGDDVHFVVAENGIPCPTNIPSSNSLCQQLDFYMSDVSLYFASDTTLYFLAGEHVMRRSMVAVAVSNFTLRGLGSIDHDEYGLSPSAVISCTDEAHSLVFLHSFDIAVTGLTIRGCGGLLNYSDADVLQYYDFLASSNSSLYYYSSPLTLGFIEVYGLEISEVSIRDGTGYGLLAINALDTNIVSSSFVRNNLDCAVDLYTSAGCYFGGNVALHYSNLFDSDTLAGGIYELNILQTNVSLGFSYPDSASWRQYFGSGLLINLNYCPIYGMDVVLDGVVAYGNTASIGGNVAFIASSLVTYYNLTINNLQSTHSNTIHPVRPQQIGGGGLFLSVGGYDSNQQCDQPLLDSLSTAVYITNANLSDNYGGGGSGGLSILKQTDFLPLVEDHIVIRNVTIARNAGFIGMGIQIFVNGIVVNAPTDFLLQDITVIDSVPFTRSITEFSPSAVFCSSVTNLTIKDLRVIDNEGTGIMLLESLLVFKGVNNLIKGNRGNFGGGMSLIGSTHIIFKLPAKVRFVENHADIKGGAIHITKLEFLNDVCSFDAIPGDTSRRFNIGGSGFYFTNNTANIAGSILYGGDVYNCLQSISSNFGATIFTQLYHLVDHDEDDLSMISSDALRVCFCDEDGIPDCSIAKINVTGLPGSHITISVAIVGQQFGTTPGTLEVEEFVKSVRVDEFLESYNNSVCHNYTHFLRLYQDVHNNNDIPSLVNSNTILSLSTVVPTSSRSTRRSSRISPITVNITMMECPIGFELSPFSGVCDCSSDFLQLPSVRPQCNVSSKEITHEGNVWLGYDEERGCLIGETCPINYCEMSSVTFVLNDTADSQCSLNRQGLLCGECREGLTLLLGSNRCDECTNYSIAMVPVFMLAGVALVVLIIVLNLTVSTGTINGLIFLANILKLAESQFFPRGPIPVLSQFISWINLDLGIETCFFVGLNTYYKVWLQYIFPFYIWFLVLVVIRLANYYGRFSRLIGRQAIPVLSTLILLSYTKLFRTITQSLHSIGIECSEDALPLAWYTDPNVEYFSLRHSILFGFSILVLIFLALPYTTFLLFNPLIEKHLSSIKNRKFRKKFQPIWQRLRPFVDAYNGPYKDETRYWTGLLLLTRLIILLTNAFSDNQEVIPAVIIFMLVLLFGISMSVGGVYKDRHCSALGAWYLVLLAAMSCAAAAGYGYVGTIVFLSLTLLTFIFILCYHVYLRVNKNKRVTNSIRKRLLSISIKSEDSNSDSKNVNKADSTDDITASVERSIETLDVRERFDNIPSVELFRRRESLIYDDDNYSVDNLATCSTSVVV